ncbi:MULTISPECIES: glycosyltransferase family 4 protein [Streptomyces]|uniref:D-inositol 3-phosphate glycosyltransferase n=2 Tax=Streptomyces TaxID=1883 RepID=A0ABV9IKJ9_9ACTN
MKASEEQRPLLVNTTWSPLQGGVPTWNRSLAIALVEAGYPTACLVERATEAEHEDARRHGVTLFTAARTPAGPSLLLPARPVLDLDPNLVIGHDRFSGPAAWAYARHFAHARLVHIVHTAPPEIEPYKNSGRAGLLIAEREQITLRMAASADVVAAVGPRLRRYAADLLSDESGPGQVLRLDPGLTAAADPAPVRRPPAKHHVLVLGRTDDVVLKGLDIAARAVAVVATRDSTVGLRVRGAPQEQCDALHRKLVRLSGLARERIDVRAYTVDPAELRRDLVRSAVCVMPSRAEGLGLVALEAIAAGTPVLVSAKSGAAELLLELLGRLAEPMIVDIHDDGPRDATAWAAAIEHILRDLPAALRYAGQVRELLAGRLTWGDTVATLMRALTTSPATTPS